MNRNMMLWCGVFVGSMCQVFAHFGSLAGIAGTIIIGRKREKESYG